MSYSIGKTSGVLIGDEEVVKVFNLRNKSIKPTRGSYELCWLREKTCLERLKGKLHFPQLKDSDQASLSLQMTIWIILLVKAMSLMTLDLQQGRLNLHSCNTLVNKIYSMKSVNII